MRLASTLANNKSDAGGTAVLLPFQVTDQTDQPAQSRIIISGFEEEFSSFELGVAICEILLKSEDVNMFVRATDAEGRSGRRNCWEHLNFAPTDEQIEKCQTMPRAAIGRL
ncbi:hypothetical protein [Bremerella cremea]|uniref:hypothetical protein n=1 Tax=Bremerella cremea TaxID=1031537 RepID=UPI0011C06FF1|nr:hypothetical protein [Bremerella cremea]